MDETIMKLCPFCNKEKPYNCFSYSSAARDGHSRRCKECDQWRHRSFDGKLRSMYRSQFASSKKRHHHKPNYTLEEFTIWAIKHDYDTLYRLWKESDFNKYLAPSGDRVNNDLPYTLENIQLITWGDNEQNAHTSRKAGQIINHHTAVKQFTKEGRYLRTFVSQAEAAREVGVPQGNICQVLNGQGRRKTVGGFKWEYA